MANRFLVSTECPTCGAPLDFSEGTNALQCGYCNSNLLVTGRKQVLSYALMPQLDERHAVSLVGRARRERGELGRVRKRQLYFIPYYRLTGHDLRWEAESASDSEDVGSGDLLTEAALRLKGFQPREFMRSDLQLRDRYVEKNFIACQLKGASLYSLGMRPAVLPLTLFHKATLEALGKIVRVTISAEEALDRGLQTVGPQQLVYRQVLGRMLSVIYAPIWVVEAEQHGKISLALVDAISQSIYTLDAEPALYQILDQSLRTDLHTVGFRPLVCPNCGWDLPLQAEAIAFPCGSCGKMWLLDKADLIETVSEVATLAQHERHPSNHYLPFWKVQTSLPESPAFSFVLPAFRYRRLKLLVDLAAHLSRIRPTCAVSETAGEKGEKEEICYTSLAACFYDPDDAIRMVHFICSGMAAQSWYGAPLPVEEPFSTRQISLLWLPYWKQGAALNDPLTGRRLPLNLLI